MPIIVEAITCRNKKMYVYTKVSKKIRHTICSSKMISLHVFFNVNTPLQFQICFYRID